MDPTLLTTTQAVDPVFILIFGISLVLLIGITATMIWFAYRYHRSRAPEPTSEADGNLWLEIVWTVLPTLLVMGMFYYGWTGYLTLRNVPKDAMPVTATARQWAWTFTYANGKTSGKLFVPVGKPVQVELVSEDVLHGFYLPAFRVKRDVVPGMKNYAWFVAEKPGSYDLFCSQFCGVGHSAMITTVEALPEHQFEEWYNTEKPAEENAEGRHLLAKYGCTGCHSLNGSKMVGPTLKGLFGRQVLVTTDGKERTITVDADYIKRSVLDPQADIVKGFPPVMPSFQGKINEHDLESIIEFFSGATEQPEAKARAGKALATKLGCVGCHSDDGSKRVGPSFKGIFGRPVTVLTDGKERTVTADADYIERSLKDPKADVVKGYPAIMPPFDKLEGEQVEALVDYLKSLQ